MLSRWLVGNVCACRSGVILTTGNTHSSLKILLKVKKKYIYSKIKCWIGFQLDGGFCSRVCMCAFTFIYLFSGIFFILTKYIVIMKDNNLLILLTGHRRGRISYIYEL